jgi:hypothetical protein
MKTLKYYSTKDNQITEVIFDKYTIDTSGKITNKKSGNMVSHFKSGKYNRCGLIDDDGKRRKISVSRAIISTFIGPPPTALHTADHIDKDPNNDTVENIRWLCKSGQRDNQSRLNTYNSSFIVVKDGVEKTIKEWIEHFKDSNHQLERTYTKGMITYYAQQKCRGFYYKEYPTLPGEIWKIIENSQSYKGHWEISNMSRIKYVTKYAEHVLSGESLSMDKDYPVVNINRQTRGCHTIAFMTFFPEEYTKKKKGDMILHRNDNKMDFRPHNLRIGTATENAHDAYDNGCYDGTKKERQKCVSYINGIFEKEHDSQQDAARYLRTIGVDKASQGGVWQALDLSRDGKDGVRYDRTWKLL